MEIHKKIWLSNRQCECQFKPKMRLTALLRLPRSIAYVTQGKGIRHCGKKISGFESKIIYCHSGVLANKARG